MKKVISLAAYALLVSAFLVSCGGDDDEKEDDPIETPTTETPTTVSPSYEFENSAGFFAAINTQTELPSVAGVPDLGIPTSLSFITAAAGIWETPGGAFVDAGTITFAGETLDKNENNSYTLVPDADALTGLGSITESDLKAWTVQTPEISYTNTNDYPEVTGFSAVAKTITKGAEYEMNWGATTGGADSVLVVVSSGETIMKTVEGASSSVTLSAEETDKLSKGSTVLVQVTPYNINPQTFSGKVYYFINQTTYSALDAVVE